LAAHPYRAQFLAVGRIEPPLLKGAAVHLVAICGRLAVLVEPQLAGDRETGGRLVAHAALSLNELETCVGRPPINRQAAPLLGKGRLTRVHRRHAVNFGDAEPWVGAESDKFFAGDRLGAFSVAERCEIVRAIRLRGDGPLARPHLRRHHAAVVDCDWDRAVDRCQLPSVGQQGAKGFLSTFA